ncbi:hypothetical protein ACHQM5_030439 [Ranunculus cassubicifolius]
MGTLNSLRKAYGALKDSTKVGLAKVNSEFKDLDIAIVKATNHVERPPKERHVRKIFNATSAVRPRADVAYCIHALARRLAKTGNWIVALKTLIVVHRTLREGDPTFREELLNYSHRGHILQISNFKDDSSALAWDCSAWVRTYALFLEERLECFRVLKYDIEAERWSKPTHHRQGKGHSRTRVLARDDLLEHLPALQQLLYRLISCQPEGAAFTNYLIQYALALVLKESFKIYCAINDGIINLMDMYFEMSRHDAIKALNIYKRAGQQAENLADFYEFCKGLELARNFQFPTLRQPPPSCLGTMEEYIREAPRIGSVSNKRLEYTEKEEEQPNPQPSPPESEKPAEEANEEPSMIDMEEESPPEPEPEPEPEPPKDTGDLLGLNEISPIAMQLEESNALALAIVPPEGSNPVLPDIGGTSGWELALVTRPSSNTTQVTGSKMAGGFDRLLLDSLYEDDASRRQHQQNMGYQVGMGTPNPFEPHDPFSMSNNIAPPPNVQMALMSQQQQQYMMNQQQYMMNHQQHYPQQQYLPQYPQEQQNWHPYSTQQQTQPMGMGPSNPFGDPFTGLAQIGPPPSGNHTLI